MSPCCQTIHSIYSTFIEFANKTKREMFFRGRSKLRQVWSLLGTLPGTVSDRVTFPGGILQRTTFPLQQLHHCISALYLFITTNAPLSEVTNLMHYIGPKNNLPLRLWYPATTACVVGFPGGTWQDFLLSNINIQYIQPFFFFLADWGGSSRQQRISLLVYRTGYTGNSSYTLKKQSQTVLENRQRKSEEKWKSKVVNVWINL